MPRYKLSPEEWTAEKERKDNLRNIMKGLDGNVNKCAVEIYPRVNPSFCVNLKFSSKMMI